MNRQPKISTLDIIIVNWNAGPQLRAGLESIAAADRAGFRLGRVVIVDNASTDGSAEGLGDIDLPLLLIRNAENRGFGTAANQGAAGSAANYLLFFNPDARVYPDTLRRSVAFMEAPAHTSTGILGVQLTGDGGHVSRTCARFPAPRHFFAQMLGLNYLLPRRFPIALMTDWDHSESRPVDHVMGSYFFVRRALFAQLGGFDERFFMYLEDLDFSLRAHRAGWASFYLADVQAYHRGGGVSQQVKARRLFYSLRSRILYGYKHFGRRTAAGLMLGTLCLEPFARVALGIAHRSGRDIIETLHGYWLLWGALPGMVRRL